MRLGLRGCPFLSDQGLEALARTCTGLRHLNLRYASLELLSTVIHNMNQGGGGGGEEGYKCYQEELQAVHH